jgi:hypothetical protein
MGASKNSSAFDGEKIRMAGQALSAPFSSTKSDAELSTYARYSPELPSKTAAVRDLRSRYLSSGSSSIPYSSFAPEN